MNTPLSSDAWHERALALPRDGRPFIDGQRVEADAAEHFDVLNACSGEPLARLPDCGQAAANRAVASARAAFDDDRWSTVSSTSASVACRPKPLQAIVGWHEGWQRLPTPTRPGAPGNRDLSHEPSGLSGPGHRRRRGHLARRFAPAGTQLPTGLKR